MSIHISLFYLVGSFLSSDLLYLKCPTVHKRMLLEAMGTVLGYVRALPRHVILLKYEPSLLPFPRPDH